MKINKCVNFIGSTTGDVRRTTFAQPEIRSNDNK